MACLEEDSQYGVGILYEDGAKSGRPDGARDGTSLMPHNRNSMVQLGLMQRLREVLTRSTAVARSLQYRRVKHEAERP